MVLVKLKQDILC